MPILREISYRGVDKTPYIEEIIQAKIDKLPQVCPHLSSCRIAVEKPQDHQRTGSPYRVRIDMTIPPGHELVVRREPGEGDLHDELPAVLARAFDAARRLLKQLTDKQRGETKTHPSTQANGVVDRLFARDQYGFLKDDHGRQIYFHANSVTSGDFDRLEVGTGVRFAEESGDEGPQATFVQIRDKRPHSKIV